jgi:hypothetical protein
MTRLFKESKNQLDKVTWSALGDLSAPLFNDFRETFHDFWEQTIYPVFHMISQTFSILWHQALLPAVHHWVATRKERWTHGGFGKKKAKQNVKSVVALDSIPLRKIYGALGDRWSKESQSDHPIRVLAGNQNPWIAAEKRTMTLISGNPKASMASTILKDDIQGLDDIFTSPVQGSFLDVVSKQGRGGKAKHAYRDARVTPKPAAVVKQEPVSPGKGSINRMAELAQTQEALRQEAMKLGRRVKSVAESTENWFNREMPAKVSLSIQLDEKVPVPYRSYSLDVASAVTPASSPVSTQSTAEMPVTEASKPLRALPNFVNAPSQAHKSNAQSRHLAPRPKPAELPEDLNGLGYMAQNNRILSNSISNLVDRYFHQASLEEESHYY